LPKTPYRDRSTEYIAPHLHFIHNLNDRQVIVFERQCLQTLKGYEMSDIAAHAGSVPGAHPTTALQDIVVAMDRVTATKRTHATELIEGAERELQAPWTRRGISTFSGVR
jgi:hypothetical protein